MQTMKPIIASYSITQISDILVMHWARECGLADGFQRDVIGVIDKYIQRTRIAFPAVDNTDMRTRVQTTDNTMLTTALCFRVHMRLQPPIYQNCTSADALMDVDTTSSSSQPLINSNVNSSDESMSIKAEMMEEICATFEIENLGEPIETRFGVVNQTWYDISLARKKTNARTIELGDEHGCGLSIADGCVYHKSKKINTNDETLSLFKEFAGVAWGNDGQIAKVGDKISVKARLSADRTCCNVSFARNDSDLFGGLSVRLENGPWFITVASRRNCEYHLLPLIHRHIKV